MLREPGKCHLCQYLAAVFRASSPLSGLSFMEHLCVLLSLDLRNSLQSVPREECIHQGHSWDIQLPLQIFPVTLILWGEALLVHFDFD